MIKNNILFFLVVLFSVSSCVSIDINGNGYKQLQKSQVKHLKQFSIDSTEAIEDPKSNLSLVEITGDDVKKVLNKYAYTWVLIWKPYCHGPHCYPLYYYERIDKANRKNDLKLLPVSEGYYTTQISNHLERASFDRDVYVIKDGAYGHNAKKGRKAFLHTIINNKTIEKKQLTHLVYKGNKLIYYGTTMSEKTMDSVLHLN